MPDEGLYESLRKSHRAGDFRRRLNELGLNTSTESEVIKVVEDVSYHFKPAPWRSPLLAEEESPTPFQLFGTHLRQLLPNRPTSHVRRSSPFIACKLTTLMTRSNRPSPRNPKQFVDMPTAP